MFNPIKYARRTMPDISEIGRLLDAAETPDLQRRDPRTVFYLVQRAVERNLKLMGLRRTRRTALSSFGWTITPFDNGNEARAQEANRRLSDTIDTIIEEHTQTAFFGCRLIETTSELVNNERRVYLLPRKPATQLYYSKKLDAVRVMQDDNQLSIVEEINPNSLEYTTSGNIVEIDPDSESGIASALFVYETLRLGAVADWADVVRLLKGLLHAKDSGATEEDTIAAEGALSTAYQGGWVRTSDLLSMEHVKLVGDGASGSADQFVAHIETAQTIGILGQANTTELPNNGGSRAAVSVLDRISDDIMWSDMKRVTKTINRLLLIDSTLNYGTTPEWMFSFNKSEYTDRESNAIVVREALATGQPFLSSEIYQQLGFTKPEGVPDIIQQGAV